MVAPLTRQVGLKSFGRKSDSLCTVFCGAVQMYAAWTGMYHADERTGQAGAAQAGVRV